MPHKIKVANDKFFLSFSRGELSCFVFNTKELYSVIYIAVLLIQLLRQDILIQIKLFFCDIPASCTIVPQIHCFTTKACTMYMYIPV